MPPSTISPLFSPGAGRSTEGSLYSPWPPGTSYGSQAFQRGGAFPGTIVSGGSNWGLGGTLFQADIYKGMRVVAVRGGTNNWGTGFQLCTQQPFLPFWPIGYWAFDAVIGWPADLAGVESGIVLSYLNVARPVSLGDQGIAIYNDGGTLKFKSVGAAGSETVVLAWPTGATARDLTWIRVELLSATATAAASITVKVNNALAITRTWSVGHKLPIETSATNGAIGCCVGQNSAVTQMNVAFLSLWSGPAAPGVAWPQS